jgi:PTS system nitrogen regulatory IIA component
MYLNVVELADSFGVSEKVVEDWIRDEGLPSVPDRGRLLFDRARVALWATAHGLTARAGFLAPENGAFTNGLDLAPMLRIGGIWRDVPSSGVSEVLERVIAGLPAVPGPVRALLAQRLRAKGGINWAPVGGGFALPHFSTRVTLGRGAGVVALLFLREALPLTEPLSDGVSVTRLFFFIPRDVAERGAPDEELFQALAAADEAGVIEPKREDRA